MSPRARVDDVATAMFVLDPTDRRVRVGPIWLTKLCARYTGHRGPMRLRRVEIEALVQVDPHAQARFVDVEEATKPRAEEADHRGSQLANSTLPSLFDPSPAYSATPAARKLASSSVPSTRRASASHSAISRCFRVLAGFGRRCGPQRRFEGVKGTSRTQREALDLETPSSSAICWRVRPAARRRRAASCSSSLPRYPTVSTVCDRV